MNLRRALLAFIVSLCLGQLPGCGVTQWQRTRQSLADAMKQMDSPEFQAAVAGANPGVPREEH